MADVKIPVSAEFDSGDIDRVVQQFTGQMNRLASSVAQVNNTKFEPVSSTTVDDIKKVTQQFEALKRISDSFRNRLKETGQDKLGLFDIDFHKLYEDQRAGARKSLDVLQYVTAGTTLASKMPKSASDDKGSPHSSVPDTFRGSPSTNGWQHWGGNIFHSAMGAAGPGGQIVGNAMSAGMSGGMKAGLMGLAGGFAAYGAASLVSSAKDKVDDVGQEMIGYDHLKRSLGDVNVEFDMLKGTLRSASNELAITYSEGQKLGVEFAKISGLSRDQANNIAKEVAISGGFAWSFGADKHQTNQTFAQMRQFGVTNNDSDTRRIALLLGEGIARGGAFAKADEFLQAVAGFTAQTARSSLTVPNVEAYTGMLSSMLKSGIPGLDPQGSAALLGRVNESIAAGGRAGEAGQNFMFRALGSANGLNPVEAMYLQQGGAFATPKQMFGENTVFRKFAENNNMPIPDAANSTTTNLDSVLTDINKSQRDPYLKLDAISNLMGINYSQAMAISNMHHENPEALGGMSARLQRLGKNISDVSYTGIPMLANIETGGKKELSGVISDLRERTGDDKLDKKERESLSDAIRRANETGDDEPLKDVLTELTVTRGMQQTEGKQTQTALANIHNRLLDVATPLLGPLNDTRDGILFIASKLGATGPQSIKEELYKNEKKEIRGGSQRKIRELSKEYERKENELEQQHDESKKKRTATYRKGTKPEIEQAEKEFLDIKKQRDDFAKEGRKKLDSDVAKVRQDASAQLKALEDRKNNINGDDKETYKPTPAAHALPGEPELDLTESEKSSPSTRKSKPVNTRSTPVNTSVGSMHPETRKRMDAVLAKLPEDVERKYRSDPIFLNKIAAESGWRHFDKDGNLLRSKAGAIGIGQIMPATGRDPGYGLKPLKNNSIEENLRLSYEYSQKMRDLFSGNLKKGLAAYNMGAGAVQKRVNLYGDDWLKNSPDETQRYVSSQIAGESMKQIPEGGYEKRFANQPSETRLAMDSTVNLLWPDGKKAAEPVNMQKIVYLPNPYGMSN